MSNKELTIPEAVRLYSTEDRVLLRRTIRAQCARYQETNGKKGIPSRKVGRDWAIRSAKAFEQWLENEYHPRPNKRVESNWR